MKVRLRSIVTGTGSMALGVVALWWATAGQPRAPMVEATKLRAGGVLNLQERLRAIRKEARAVPRFRNALPLIPDERVEENATVELNGHSRIKAAVTACFPTLVEERPDVAGQPLVRFTLGNAGDISRVVAVRLKVVPWHASKPLPPDVEAPSTEECLEDALVEVGFPPVTRKVGPHDGHIWYIHQSSPTARVPRPGDGGAG